VKSVVLDAAAAASVVTTSAMSATTTTTTIRMVEVEDADATGTCPRRRR
jgi:hypothetical protein